MTYRLAFLPAAERQFDALPRHIQKQMAPRLESLADTPRPPGVKALQGYHPYLRLRVGDYRVVYHVKDADHVVLVVAIGHRKDIYRQLPKP